MPIDPSAQIAPTARIHPGAIVGPGVRIGEYCVVEEDVVLGPGCRLEPYVYVKRWTSLGRDNEISAGAALGTDPQDKNFSGVRSYLRIGDGNKIREHATASRGTPPESATEIGNGNFFMTSCHIAPNGKIGDDAAIAACALLGGYVEIEDHASSKSFDFNAEASATARRERKGAGFRCCADGDFVCGPGQILEFRAERYARIIQNA